MQQFKYNRNTIRYWTERTKSNKLKKWNRKAHDFALCKVTRMKVPQCKLGLTGLGKLQFRKIERSAEAFQVKKPVPIQIINFVIIS
jgi:hypothetical protein